MSTTTSSRFDGPPPPALPVFLRLFIPVWLLVVVSATLITFILPESFMAIARVRSVSNPGATLDFLRSDSTFKAVSDRLQLETEWGNRYAAGQKLNPSEVLHLLKSRVDIQPLSSGNLVQIRAFSEQSHEAAQIANALAEATRPQAEIIDGAATPLLPARPNKPLNIILGILIGTALGALAGLIAVRLSRGFGNLRLVPH